MSWFIVTGVILIFSLFTYRYYRKHIENAGSLGASLSFIGMLLSGIGVALLVTYFIKDSLKWEPIEPFPIQVLYNQDGTIAAGQPTYYLDDLILVRGEKCHREEVKVKGRLTWTNDDPGGAILEGSMGTSVRRKGCTQQGFKNQIPPNVLHYIQELTERGFTRSVWHLSGTETPFRESGEGKSETWTTASFTILHEMRPA